MSLVTTSMHAHRQALMACTKCPELGKCVPPVGPTTASLFIIGQSAGENEVDQGMPFVGPGGKLHNKLLEAAGVERADVFLTNAVHCHPPRNRESSADELDNCRPYLVAELLMVRPKAVLCVGKDGWRVFGKRIPWGHGVFIMKASPRVLVSYHPSYFLRQGNEEGFLKLADKVKEMLS